MTFENVSLRYAPDAAWALKTVSLDIQPGELLGICGRTGACSLLPWIPEHTPSMCSIDDTADAFCKVRPITESELVGRNSAELRPNRLGQKLTVCSTAALDGNLQRPHLH